MIGRIVVALVLSLARHDPVPARWDRAAATGAIGAIRFYQRHLSSRSGRRCLFRQSCSARALTAFESLGWRKGLQETSAQLGRCGGAVTVVRAVNGETMLITGDGERFSREELSDHMLGVHG